MQTSTAELLSACSTIFGQEINATRDFLHYIQLSGLKTAYRKRALETHPDRARALGIFSDDLNEKFREVRQAYEMLLSFLEGGGKCYLKDTVFTRRQKRPTPSYHYRPKTAAQHDFREKAYSRKSSDKSTYWNKKARDHFFSGCIPNRELLLCQFLYYSGTISWRMFIDSIAWQRKQRPRMGELAVDWNILAPEQVVKILSERTLNEKFGECARRIGMINNFQHLALLGKQKLLQRPIGDFFIQNSILTPMQIDSLVNKKTLHNKSVIT